MLLCCYWNHSFPVFIRSQAAPLSDGEISLSFRGLTRLDEFCLLCPTHLPHIFLSSTMLAVGNGPKSKEQTVFSRYCKMTTCIATDVFSLSVLALPSLKSSEQSCFLRESLSTPPPPRLRKHCRQTEPTSSPLPFLHEGNDLQWTLWGQRPQQALINCVIYCLTRLCMDPSHVPV